MLKILGIILIVTAGAGLGLESSGELSERERALKEILQMIRWLKGAIISSHASLPEAFQEVSERMQESFSLLLKQTSENIRKSPGVKLEELYRTCAEETLGNLPLSRQERNLFLSMGSALGYLDMDMQKKQLEFYEGEFLRLLEELRAEMPAKKKICQSLGIMGGILLAILVW